MIATEGGQHAQKFKMAEPSDNPCSSSSLSENDEYLDSLEVAASAAAILNKNISKVCFVPIQSRGYRNRKRIQRIRFL